MLRGDEGTGEATEQSIRTRKRKAESTTLKADCQSKTGNRTFTIRMDDAPMPRPGGREVRGQRKAKETALNLISPGKPEENKFHVN